MRRLRTALGSRQAGFTLIEILVSLVVLSLALGLLVRIFSSGLGNARLAEETAFATALAESRLAEVGLAQPLAPGLREGEEQARFRWRVEVSPYDVAEAEDPDADSAPNAREPLDLAAYRVTVTVSWPSADPRRSVTLDSLRTALVE